MTFKKICLLQQKPALGMYAILLCFLFTSCADKTKKEPSRQDVNTVLTEAELPPGRPALEDAAPVFVNQADPTAPLGADNPKPTDVNRMDEMPEEMLRRKFKNLLVFHADDTMEVNNPKLATLILSRDETIAKLRVEVLDESEATDENIKMDTAMEFGSKMKARLIPFGSSRLENTFNIEALGDDVQSFKTNRKKILWQWKITPLKPGKQELKLSIQIIEKDGETVSLPARNIPVVIFAKPESFFTQMSIFFEKYWQFLITAILVPLITAWVTSMIRNKGPRHAHVAAAAPAVMQPEPPVATAAVTVTPAVPVATEPAPTIIPPAPAAPDKPADNNT